MENQRQAARDRHLLPEPPVLGREFILILVEEQDLHCVPTQEARIERGGLPRARTEAVEAQRGVVAEESVIVGPRALLIVSDEPEFALRGLPRQMVDAPLKYRPLRLSGARKLQRVAGAHFAIVGALKGSEQGRWLDLALGQPVRNRTAVRDELGLPYDAMLAVRQFAPSRI